MDLSTIHQDINRRKRKKRVGRGPGSGHGKTSTRGNKGQWASAGAGKPPEIFEGGQMPLFRRVPKRGFTRGRFEKHYLVVNIGDLDTLFKDGDTVDHEKLRTAGLANGPADGVKILGQGDITKKLTVRAHFFSKSAAEKIKAKGGTAEVVPGPKKPVRNKMRPRPSKQES